MNKIKLSVNCLAKFMTSTSSQQRKILQGIKYKTDENQAMINYYKDARRIIKEYHKSKFNKNWLINKAKTLNQLSLSVSSQSSKRLKRNAEVIKNYSENFENKNYDFDGSLKLKYSFSKIDINISSDLNLKRKNKKKIVKLGFLKEEPDTKVAKIICQLTFETCKNENILLPSSSFEYFDIDRGKILKFAREGSKLKKDIEAACLNIEAIWDTIPKPNKN